MVEEPSAKRPRGETSDQNSEVDDVQVPGQKLDYTKHLNEVDIHGKEKLDVVCTCNPDEDDEMINKIRMRVGGMYPRPEGLRPLLKEEKLYTFVSFSIGSDKRMLKESGLEINPDKYIDMQSKWIVPFMGGKRFHSMVDVACSMIHPFYKHMKYKIDGEEDHKLLGISSLPDYLIKYVAIDAYATYESWKRIENITIGLECSK
ncbi:hypothetical protein D1007_55083 [Hordeum vulgare]|nr:hypothetical protein D1007_55083 [Hordeum vulgare]